MGDLSLVLSKVSINTDHHRITLKYGLNCLQQKWTEVDQNAALYLKIRYSLLVAMDKDCLVLKSFILNVAILQYHLIPRKIFIGLQASGTLLMIQIYLGKHVQLAISLSFEGFIITIH